jgi:hypothetical protein
MDGLPNRRCSPVGPLQKLCLGPPSEYFAFDPDFSSYTLALSLPWSHCVCGFFIPQYFSQVHENWFLYEVSRQLKWCLDAHLSGSPRMLKQRRLSLPNEGVARWGHADGAPSSSVSCRLPSNALRSAVIRTNSSFTTAGTFPMMPAYILVGLITTDPPRPGYSKLR